jgi:thioredoxin-related protein
VVFPGVAGEKSKGDFIKWFKDQNYNNLIVLLDDNAQILNDFGITAFPSGIVFDGGGAPVTGFKGLMPQESIEEIMKQVAGGTYEG